MRKLTLVCCLVVGLSYMAKAQQDPMYTKYMFNSLVYNPAFAGSPEYLSVRALYRNQWWGIDGGPVTQSFSIHSPFKERVGLGFSMVNDKVGATGSTDMTGVYAYRIPFAGGKISLGVQASGTNFRTDWSRLKYKDPRPDDPSFDNDQNRWMFNVGTGAFYYTPKYYVGVSVPKLIENDLNDGAGISEDQRTASTYRHYFIAAGAAWPIKGSAIYFKPSILIKSVGLFSAFRNTATQLNPVGAPTEVDIDAGFLFYEALWIGASFRTATSPRELGGNSSFDSVDLWASYYLQNGLRIGVSYDYTISKLRTHVDGSFEVMVGYDFNYSSNKVITPRYF
ncbi:MAG: type IX secretion system membrane protein PorP/SprF [Saprospiraceae bacterium]